MKQRIFAILLTLTMMFTLVPTALAEDIEGGESKTPPTSGYCGETSHESDVRWSFNSITGVLTISGNGAMADFDNFTDSDGSYVSKAEYESSPQYGSRKLIYYVGTETYVSDTPWKDLGTAVKSIVISEGVTHVGMRAFRLPCVESITIAHSVTSIGAMAFDSEPDLTTVIWADDWSLTGHPEMKFDGFGNCNKLGKDQEFSDWLPDCFTSMNGQTINGSAFSVDFDKLNAQLTKQTGGYGSSAFQNMPNLTTATLDSRFGTHAFSGSGIKTLTISSDLTGIPEYTCENCASLTSVVIPSSITSVGDAAFRNSGLTSLTFEGDHAITFGNQAFVKNDASPKLTDLKLSENMSISDGNAIVSYLKNAGAVTDETMIEPSKFTNVLATKLTVDGSLGTEITRKNYPNVAELTIKGDSYVSADSAFSVSSSGTGKLKTLEIDVTGTATINKTAFIRESLESVKISANNLTLKGDAAFFNNSELSHIDLTGVQTITADEATRTFHIDGNSTTSDLNRYVYLNDVTCCKALQNLLSVVNSKGTSTCLITNGGTVTGDDGTFSAVTKPGYTATWYVYDQNKSDNHGTQVTRDVPTRGTTYIVKWNLDSENYVEATYKDGYSTDSKTEAVAKSGGTLAGENIFTRAGYTLTGWKVENGEDPYEPGAAVNPSANMTLVAQWTLDKPTISGTATAVYGDTVTLTASTAASGASYQWYKNGVKIDGAKIPDATTSSLKLTNVADSGAYTVKITVGTVDTDTATSNPTTVTINKATPSISISADQATMSGSGTVKLTVTPNGVPTEGKIEVTCDNGITVNNKDGMFTATLPNETKTYTFTASYAGDNNHNNAEATCKVSVTHRSSGSSSGSSTTTSNSVSASTASNGKVSLDKSTAKKGDTVTVTVTPDAGYQLDKLTVTDKNGNVLKLTDKGDGKYSFTMPDGKVEVKAVFAKEVETSPFGDVSTDAYYYKAVQWAQEKGITEGISSDLFGPKQPCTRSQIVTFLWRAAGSPEPKSTTAGMTDVVPGSYYAKAVAWAVENGITTGTAEGTFSPDATCTRAQAVTFLARAQNAKATGKTAFSDVPADSYFADAVAWAQANGVTTGTSETTFSPDDDCTRAQIVTFLYRANQGT